MEDIDFLKEHSQTENHLVYIDSANRDRKYHPHPNQYNWSLGNTFKNVVGIEVLDAAVPSTSYNVEKSAIAGFTHVTNPVQSMTVHEFIQELRYVPKFEQMMNDTETLPSPTSTAIPQTGYAAVSTFDVISSRFISGYTTDNTSKYVLFKRGIIEEAAIFNYDNYAPALSGHPLYLFDFDGVKYAIINDPNNPTFQSLVSIVSNAEYNIIVDPISNTSQTLIYYQVQGIPQSMYTQISTSTAPNLLYNCTFAFFYAQFVPGNYSVTTFLVEINRALGGTYIKASSYSASDPTIAARLQFACEYGFVLNMNMCSSRAQMGFDQFADDTETQDYIKVRYPGNDLLYAGVYNDQAISNVIVAPGVVYLLGTKYVVMRCDELEDHMFGSYSYGDFTPGVALFKMMGVNEYAQLRLDYTHFNKRPFHPIGKLSKLSLRFESPNGSLYDFKGANHVILLNIKFLVPYQKRRFERSVLNPNYTSDYVAYMGRSIQNKELSTDEDNDEDFREDVKTKFLLEEAKYRVLHTDSDSSEEVDFCKDVRV